MPASLSRPQPHPPIANTGIVLQAGKVLVHLLLLWKKKRSLFILFCCLLGNIWKKLKGWMTKGVCIQSGAAVLKDWMEERPICWGQPALGGALAWECHRPGLGWGPKVGHGPDSGGSTCDKRTMRLFVTLGAMPREWVSHLALLLKIKRNKRPFYLLADSVKKK